MSAFRVRVVIDYTANVAGPDAWIETDSETLRSFDESYDGPMEPSVAADHLFRELLRRMKEQPIRGDRAIE